MGEWNEPFFGAESQQQHTDLARLRIASDSSLSDAQKAARLAALDAALPPETRAAHERARQQQAALDAIGQAQKQGGSLDTMRAQITQTLGPEAAQRVVQMQQADDAWQARYADYASQRAQIDKQDLPPQQRDAQIAQLRQQFFTNPSDAMRAASLDRGSGLGELNPLSRRGLVWPINPAPRPSTANTRHATVATAPCDRSRLTPHSQSRRRPSRTRSPARPDTA